MECLNAQRTRIDNSFVAEVIVAHVREVRRRLPHLQLAKAVIIPESNMSHIPVQLKSDIETYYCLENHCFMIEDRSVAGREMDTPGSRTTHKKKNEMCALLGEFYLSPNKLRVLAEPITTQSEYSPVDDVREEFMKQMRAFKQEMRYHTGPDGAPEAELIYSGKKSGNDDLVMALLIAIYAQRRFFQDPRYSSQWHR